MASGVIPRGRRHKWSIDFTSRSRSERQLQAQTELPSPVGYHERQNQIADVATQDTEASLVVKKSWDVALGPLKQLPMNLFIMWMSGNSISIFPIMMVCMMLWRPVQALMSMGKTFKVLDESPQSLVQKLAYFFGNLAGVGLAAYKCSSMGLLPTHASDWISFLQPQERMEYSGGGVMM
ncbi:ER membrane protein complex subunit 4-like [Ptychodera flava]|uniref:ER membrane protein complex subunit 4-like n=1 Tax=Ptychodera flava TaxID=63121 RepID=UPI00396A9696